MKNERRLCPFKKEIGQRYGREKDGKLGHFVKERLGYCAGYKCMAYHNGRCLRLTGKELKQ